MRVKDVAGYIRNDQPLTLILGAGASLSAGIPSARDLVKQVVSTEAFQHRLEHLKGDDRKDYGKVMGALNPTNRKDLIQPLLDNSKINWGHIALACLIRQTNVQRILTFNFDLVLERSASLMGMHLPVYDFGVAPTKDITGLATPAIYHLHGQSYGLRLMNSAQETQDHANRLRAVIADSLRHHTTLVTGYSGAADGAFKVMQEEFNSQNDLFWLGYGKTPDSHLKPLLDKEFANYIGGCDFDTTMITLARELGCFPPEVIANPPAHVLEELTDVVNYPVKPETGLDILTDTRKRLKSAAGVWASETTGAGAAERDFLSGKEDDSPQDLVGMSDEERNVRAWTEVDAGVKHHREALGLTGEQREKKLIEACARYSDAARIKPDMEVAFDNWGGALLEEAKGLSGAERGQKLAVANEKLVLAKRFGGEALYNLACVHARHGEFDAALDELEECKVDGTLPDRDHLETDTDMDPLRDHPRFQALLDSL